MMASLDSHAELKPVATMTASSTAIQRTLSRLSSLAMTIHQGSVQPQTVVALQSALQFCAQEQCPLEIGEANAFSQHFKSDNLLTLDLAPLHHVLSFQPDERMITTQTGITIAELNRAISGSGLQLPFDVSEHHQLGNVLAANHMGLTHHHHHHLSHWVTGLEAITGDGRLVQYGGQVMKNVTGYDLARLFVGSQHQYGLLTAVTLRLLPQSSEQHISLWHFDDLTSALAFVRQANLLQYTHLKRAVLFKVKSLFGYKLLVKFSGYGHDLVGPVHALQQIYQQKPPSLAMEEISAADEATWLNKLDWLGSTSYEHLEQLQFMEVRMPYGQLCQMDWWLTKNSRLLDVADWVWDIAAHQVVFRFSQLHGHKEKLQAADAPKLRELFELHQGIVRAPVPRQFDLTVLQGLSTKLSPVELDWTKRLKAQFDPEGILPNGVLTRLSSPNKEMV